jgi:drug/metabolite transporter (DMT)-like permease
MRAYGELLFATIFWGFGFIASIWALDGIGPVWMTSVRFVVCILMLDTIYRVFGKLGWLGLKPLQYRFREFLSIAQPGFFLFCLLTLQTWGLKYTTATKSGFITVLYVLFIPIFEKVFLGYPVRKILWLWISLAVAGTAMICGAWTPSGLSSDFLGAFNVGDLLTFFCAISAAAHIIATAKKMSPSNAERISPVLFHIYQSAWVAIFAGILGASVEGFSWVHAMTSGAWSSKVWMGLFELGVLSSGVAFLIQVRGQRTVSPSTVGIIVLLESPWALVFSVWLLNEQLSGMQVLGAFLILGAAVAESLSQLMIERKAAAQRSAQSVIN